MIFEGSLHDLKFLTTSVAYI